jgi:CRISPR system Cascade subunit CasB
MSLDISKAVAWWHDLQPDPGQKRPGNRAALARLRRCATVTEAMQDPEAINLFRRCGGSGPHDLPLAGLTAGVLVRVRTDDPAHPRIARHLGPDNTDKPETALLKPLRFRRLLDAETPDERLIAFRRMVALAGGTVHVASLAAALLDWNESRKTRWIYDYWNAGQPLAVAEMKDSVP